MKIQLNKKVNQLTTDQGTREVIEGETAGVSKSMARNLCFRGTGDDEIAEPLEAFAEPDFDETAVEDSTKKELHGVLPNDISDQYEDALKDELKETVRRYYGFAIPE